MARSAGRQRDLERVHRLLERGHRVEGVNEPQIHVIGFEPRERVIERVEQGAPRGVDDAAVRRAPYPSLRADLQFAGVRNPRSSSEPMTDSEPPSA